MSVYETAAEGGEMVLFPDKLRVEIDSPTKGVMVLVVQRQRQRSYEHVRMTEHVAGDPTRKTEIKLTDQKVKF